MTDYERQNNARLSELSAKVSALRDVTVDIYDSASGDHTLIDRSNEVFANLGGGLRNSIGRVKLMAQRNGSGQVFKMAGIAIAAVVGLWIVWGWIV